MTQIDFKAEFGRLRAVNAPRGEFEELVRGVTRAINALRTNAHTRSEERSKLIAEIGEAERRNHELSIRGHANGGLLEKLDPAAFDRLLSDAADLQEAIAAPEELLGRLGQLRDFIRHFALGSPTIRDFLVLPLADANYRAELEKVILLDRELREVLTSAQERL